MWDELRRQLNILMTKVQVQGGIHTLHPLSEFVSFPISVIEHCLFPPSKKVGHIALHISVGMPVGQCNL